VLGVPKKAVYDMAHIRPDLANFLERLLALFGTHVGRAKSSCPIGQLGRRAFRGMPGARLGPHQQVSPSGSASWE
jgi:hypothetical protein